MSSKTASKSEGKKRARVIYSDSESESSLSPLEEVSDTPVQPVKRKPKRAETRPCPICNELVPLRLLATHTALELERVDDIMKHIGDPEVVLDAHASVKEYQAEDDQPGPSSRARRSALHARRSITLPAVSHSSLISGIKRRRKNRNNTLRDMGRKEEEYAYTAASSVCPLCLQHVLGDEDVMEAHVDACIAHAARQQDEEAERAVSEQQQSESFEDTERIGNVSGLRGAGFHIRDRNMQDIDDEIDIDGDDEAVFGSAQFTEGDILDPDAEIIIDSDVDIDDTAEDAVEHEAPVAEKSLRDLVAEGKFVLRAHSENLEAVKATMTEVMGIGENDKMDLAILSAKRSNNPAALIKALEHKVRVLEETRVSSSTSSICRICLDPYSEPTVSTGCWHTCCRDCWLRCLGATKLCPICKRITAATELRRVYL